MTKTYVVLPAQPASSRITVTSNYGSESIECDLRSEGNRVNVSVLPRKLLIKTARLKSHWLKITDREMVKLKNVNPLARSANGRISTVYLVEQ